MNLRQWTCLVAACALTVSPPLYGAETPPELDEATTQHPVVFNWQYASHQVQVLNTPGLKAAGITRDTPDPPGGKIVKDAQGEPTGRLEEPHALTAKFLTRKSPSDGDYLQV